jgi:SPP1 gp7 family putative phage head morphogenesis protein
MSKFNRLFSLEKQITEDLRPFFLKNKQLLDKLNQIQYEQAFYQHAFQLDKETGVALKWGLLDQNAVKAAVGNLKDYSAVSDIATRSTYMYHGELRYRAFKNLSTETVQRVLRTVNRGITTGDSYPKMTRAIKKTLGSSYEAASRIARTEGQRAYALGTQQSYQDAEDMGVELDEIWVASLDDRTRPEHAALDGKVKDKEKGGWYVPGLGIVAGPLQSGDPAFTINCRCTTIAQVNGIKPTVRRIKGEGVTEYKTFAEWAKETGLRKNLYGQKIDIGA